MNQSEQTLLDLLENPNLVLGERKYLNSLEMSNLFTNSALLVTVMGYLKEQFWLQGEEDKKNDDITSYKEFITPLFIKELASLDFLKDFLTKSGSANIKLVLKDSKAIELKVIALMMKRSKSDQKEFLIESLNVMSGKFIKEEDDQDGHEQNLGHNGLRLYRTFDKLDDFFDLDYQQDLDMDVDYNAVERLYQSGGVGVQSGYSTILLALNELSAEPGSLMLDLGSGYGRVGLVCSLLRPDVDFIGYEFVPHRVDISNKACESFDLQESAHFETQDLSLKDFSIPEADYFYLYDPFTKETYDYVLQQIVAISQKKKVTIVTKGNARGWLLEIAKENSWPEPIYLDEGNLCIFKSV